MAPRAELPLFPDESAIAIAVLGADRASNWETLSSSLERWGLPRIDPVFGGRYWPSVKLWLDGRAGINAMTVIARPGGKEPWK